MIEEIWELDYGARLQIPVFKCQWVKHPNGVTVDGYGLTAVDLNNIGHKDEPWVLADRVAHVFYVVDPSNQKRHVVVSGKQRIVGVEKEVDDENYNEYEEMELFTRPENIKYVEAAIDKSLKPYMRRDGNGKVV